DVLPLARPQCDRDVERGARIAAGPEPPRERALAEAGRAVKRRVPSQELAAVAGGRGQGLARGRERHPARAGPVARGGREHRAPPFGERGDDVEVRGGPWRTERALLVRVEAEAPGLARTVLQGEPRELDRVLGRHEDGEGGGDPVRLALEAGACRSMPAD